MRTMSRTVACSTILTMLFCSLPLALAADGTGRLDGLVIGTDGKPAAGSTVHLIDRDGESIEAQVDEDGKYSLDVSPGSYSIGIETASGEAGPVMAPPVRIDSGRLVRRDIKLASATPKTVDLAIQGNYSFGSWFSGLGTGAQAGVVLGFLVAAYGVVELVDDDDDPEPISTPSGSGG